MGFLDVFKSKFDDLANQVSKFQNGDFLEAAVASAIAVSAADGTIDPEEKQKLAKFISMHATMKLFTPSEVVKYINKYVDLFEFDNAMGMQEVLKAVGKLANKEDQARTMVLLACAIGGADGDFDESEKAVVRKLCNAAGLNARDFSV